MQLVWTERMTVFGTFRKLQQDCKRCTPYQGILYFQNDTWLSTALPSTIFTKLAEAQHHYVQLSDAEFHPIAHTGGKNG
jgi:hypothetical protein